MKNLTTHLQATGFLFLILLSAPNVWAEDIEIYFAGADGNRDSNILFMLDTSGSMGWCENGQRCDEADRIRMNQLKSAFSDMMDGLSGDVRVGLGRLNGGSGGYILYPIRGLDEPANELLAESVVSAPLDDAVQTTTSIADQTLTADTLRLPDGGVVGGNVGMVLREVRIPRYAVIESAQLEVQASENSTNTPMAFNLAFDAGLDLPDFATRSVQSMMWNWSADYPLTVNERWRRNNTHEMDVTALVQEAVNQPGWCAQQDLALRFSGTLLGNQERRRIGAFDRIDNDARYNAPKLTVSWRENDQVPLNQAGLSTEQSLSCTEKSYSLSIPANDGLERANGRVQLNNNQLVLSEGLALAAFRFPAVNLNVMGTSADLVNEAVLTINGTSSTSSRGRGLANGVVTFLIQGESGDARALSTTNGDISSRGYVSTSISQQVSAASNNFDRDFQFDVTAMVREMMRGGWTPGGALLFTVQALDANGRRFILASQEGGVSEAARLEINFSTADMLKGVPLVRDRLKDIVNGLTPGGGTPLAEAHTEMMAYMMGQTPLFGDGVSNPDTIDGSFYDSPIDSIDMQCASNHVVLMTDGEPNSDSQADNVLLARTDLNADDLGKCDDVDNRDSDASFSCMAHLARWSADVERNDIARKVTTHMLGFYLDQDTLEQMESVSSAGGEGLTVGANSADELKEAFSKIVNSVVLESGSGAAPAVAINQLNRFSHLNQVYYALFKPSGQSRWQGNLKRYQLDFENERIVGEDGELAVNKDTGLFVDSANSWWGRVTDPDTGTQEDIVDGDKVTLGGALNELNEAAKQDPPEIRKLFTLAAAQEPTPSGAINEKEGITGTPLSLIQATTDVTVDQLGSLLNLSDDELGERVDFLLSQWGDALHSSPKLVNYGLTGDPANATTPEEQADIQDNTIYAATNDGMLHAIDAKTGRELFAFIPQEELAKTELRYQSAVLGAGAPPALDGTDPKRVTYGLDGGITVWRNGGNAASGDIEHIYLYVGQRRGGNAYYALDVTDRNSPKVLWKIKGGQAPFENLGQTWSQPTLARINLNGDKVPVLIFGGGYSPENHDQRGDVSLNDVTGNAVYIVNAHNGQLIWSVSNQGAFYQQNDMKWAIPASPSVVDLNNDGAVDFIYVTDLGGQVFRIDLDDDNTGITSLVSQVVTFAQLGVSDNSVDSTIANHRRFFSSPTVALLRDELDEKYLRVTVGSGYRAHPLDVQTDEAFYVLDDYGAVNGNSATTIVKADLHDIDSAAAPGAEFRGWYVDLDNGEKVLAPAAITNGVVFFTTFVPEIEPGVCRDVVGSSKLYALDLATGAPVLDLDEDGAVEAYVDLSLPGLPPLPQVMIGTNNSASILVGTQLVNVGDIDIDGPIRKSRWQQLFTQEAANRILEDVGGITVD